MTAPFRHPISSPLGAGADWLPEPSADYPMRDGHDPDGPDSQIPQPECDCEPPCPCPMCASMPAAAQHYCGWTPTPARSSEPPDRRAAGRSGPDFGAADF